MSNPANNMPATDGKPSRTAWIGFLFVISIGIFFRLYNLGYAAMRGDTINYWCMGIENAAPFSMAVTQWFVFTFDLVESVFARRLPSAVWGLLTIPAAYGLGKAINGKRFGLLMAALIAMNPFCIQCSREAYFYAPLTLGAFFAVWSSVELFRYSLGQTSLNRKTLLINAAGFFLLTAVHPPGWPMAVMLGIVNASFLRKKYKNSGKLCGNDLILLAIYLSIALMAVFSSWGPLELIRHTASGESATTKSTFTESGNSFGLLYHAITNLSWGWTPARLIFTVTVFALGLIVCHRRAKTNPIYWLLIDLVFFGGTLQMLARKITLSPYEARYFLPVFPAFLAVLGLGLTGLPELLKKRSRIIVKTPLLFIITGFGLWIAPGYQITQLNGYVKPYNDIRNWVDSNLPQDTLVLVDRWLEVNNELFIYNSTNITFTFTVPNEPVETYLSNGWQDSVKSFCELFPRSAFLEIRKSYWEHPAVGPWRWPAQHFEQHVAFTNAAALKLRAWGLGSRQEFYSAYNNGLIVDLYYDTTADILNKAKAEGKKLFALYGKGWHYAKPWQMTGDFFDWRTLENEAEIDLYNLTPDNLQAAVYISGVVPRNNKHVKLSSGSVFKFKADQFMEARASAIDIPPGHTTITLTDPYWMYYNEPLLVADVQCVQATSTNLSNGTTITIAPAPNTPVKKSPLTFSINPSDFQE